MAITSFDIGMYFTNFTLAQIVRSKSIQNFYIILKIETQGI